MSSAEQRIAAEAAANLTRQLEAELEAIVAEIAPGAGLDALVGRCAVIPPDAEGRRTFLIDGRPVLQVGPVKIEQTGTGVRVSRELKRL